MIIINYIDYSVFISDYMVKFELLYISLSSLHLTSLFISVQTTFNCFFFSFHLVQFLSQLIQALSNQVLQRNNIKKYIKDLLKPYVYPIRGFIWAYHCCCCLYVYHCCYQINDFCRNSNQFILQSLNLYQRPQRHSQSTELLFHCRNQYQLYFHCSLYHLVRTDHQDLLMIS